VAIGACALIGAGARQGDPRPIAIVHGTLGDATLLIRVARPAKGESRARPP